MNGLTGVEKKVWQAASEIQRNRPRGAPAPSFLEIAELAGVSKTTVSGVMRVLESRGIVERYGTRRACYLAKLAPKPKATKKDSENAA